MARTRGLGFEKDQELIDDAARLADKLSGFDPEQPTTQVISWWKNPNSGKISMAKTGREASLLEQQGFIEVEGPNRESDMGGGDPGNNNSGNGGTLPADPPPERSSSGEAGGGGLLWSALLGGTGLFIWQILNRSE